MTRVSLDQAVQYLKEGHVVGIPTETVYGLAASLYHNRAIEHIFSLKNRPLNNPLIIHIAAWEDLAHFEAQALPHLEILAQSFWPGPLTVVLPINPALIPEKARAGLPTAAFRIPQHDLTLELLQKTGPLVMPSANLSGKPSSTQPHHLEEDFGPQFPVLDGGVCKRGLESTILYYSQQEWEIIRQGAITPEQISPCLGYSPAIRKKENGTLPLCPGQMYRHYAPKAKLVLQTTFDPQYQGVILGFNNRDYPKQSRFISLGDLNHPQTIGENLYFILRKLDEEGLTEAAVDIDFPSQGLLSTIKERLTKAACLEEKS